LGFEPQNMLWGIPCPTIGGVALSHWKCAFARSEIVRVGVFVWLNKASKEEFDHVQYFSHVLKSSRNSESDLNYFNHGALRFYQRNQFWWRNHGFLNFFHEWRHDVVIADVNILSNPFHSIRRLVFGQVMWIKVCCATTLCFCSKKKVWGLKVCVWPRHFLMGLKHCMYNSMPS